MSPFSFIIIRLILKFFVKKKKFLNRALKFEIYKWNMYGIKELETKKMQITSSIQCIYLTKRNYGHQHRFT